MVRRDLHMKRDIFSILLIVGLQLCTIQWMAPFKAALDRVKRYIRPAKSANFLVATYAHFTPGRALNWAISLYGLEEVKRPYRFCREHAFCRSYYSPLDIVACSRVQMSEMPCAAGGTCKIPSQTLDALGNDHPSRHHFRGGCSGRLHRICGELDVDEASDDHL